MTDPRHDFGRRAEQAAEEYLGSKGFRLIERNARNRLGEIDLVMEDGGTLVFVEVKAGRVSPDFSPLDHFDSKKKRKLLTLGKAYLARFGEEREARFDLVWVVPDGEKFRIDHLEDVIQDSPL